MLVPATLNTSWVQPENYTRKAADCTSSQPQLFPLETVYTGHFAITSLAEL